MEEEPDEEVANMPSLHALPAARAPSFAPLGACVYVLGEKLGYLENVPRSTASRGRIPRKRGEGDRIEHN